WRRRKRKKWLRSRRAKACQMQERGRLVNRTINLIFLMTIMVLLLSCGSSYALQEMTFTKEGDSAFVNISRKDLNVIKLSTDDVKAYTKSKSLDIKVDGKHVMVGIMAGEDGGAEPQEIVFLTGQGVYS